MPPIFKRSNTTEYYTQSAAAYRRLLRDSLPEALECATSARILKQAWISSCFALTTEERELYLKENLPIGSGVFTTKSHMPQISGKVLTDPETMLEIWQWRLSSIARKAKEGKQSGKEIEVGSEERKELEEEIRRLKDRVGVDRRNAQDEKERGRMDVQAEKERERSQEGGSALATTIPSTQPFTSISLPPPLLLNRERSHSSQLPSSTISSLAFHDSQISSSASQNQITLSDYEDSNNRTAPKRQFNPRILPPRSKSTRIVLTTDRSTRIQIKKAYIKQARRKQREKKKKPAQPAINTYSAVSQNENSEELPGAFRPLLSRTPSELPSIASAQTGEGRLQRRIARHQPYWKYADYLPLSVVESSSEDD